MNTIATQLDQFLRGGDLSKYDLRNLGLIMWGWKNRYVGLVIDDEILVLDYKHFSTFRIRKSNLGRVKHRLHYYEPKEMPFSADYVRSYFQANEDNPYGMWNYMLNLVQEHQVDEITQLPPLNFKKNEELVRLSIQQMQEQSLAADVVFTFDRNSGLSQLIRNTDRGMWSHVAMVSGEGTLYEATTSGVVESDFSRLSQSHLDVGLYRLRTSVSDESREKIKQSMKKRLGIKGYNWYSVVRLYLQLRWRIPYRRRRTELTPADLIYGNQFQLLSFA